MSAIKKVILIGAGGNIGPSLLVGLKNGGFDVTILSRASSKSTFGDEKVIRVADDYPHAELVKAFNGQDAVISAINVLNAQDQKRFIDAAIEAGVRRFLPSEFGGDTSDKVTVEFVPILKPKAEVLEYLKARQDKIEWTAIPTGAFYDWGLTTLNFLGFDLNTHKAVIVAGGDNKFPCTPVAEIGRNTAKILQQAHATANRHVKMDSFEASQNEILSALEKTTGKKWEVEHRSGQDLIDSSRKTMAAGDFTGAIGLIQALLFVPGYMGTYHARAVENAKALGFDRLDLVEETRKVVAAQA